MEGQAKSRKGEGKGLESEEKGKQAFVSLV